MLKKFLSVVAVACIGTAAFAQGELPNTSVRALTGKSVAFNSTIESGKVTLVSFWATWCVPCKKEIKNIREKMSDWKKEVDFNYMTVSVDDSRATAMVKSYVTAQGWDFPTYLDPNSDLKRSLNFQTVPFTLIVDANGKIVYQHTGYEEGAENEVFEKLKAAAAEKK